MSYLELQSLGKRFPGATAPAALVGVSLGVEQGERFGLLGPSGAGKTTLLRLVAGLETPDAGEVLLGGAALSAPRRVMPPEKRAMGMVFQTLGLWGHLDAWDHLDLVLRARLSRREERAAEIRRLLALARLDGKDARRPGELSGGERQRLAIVRALAPRPALLLLDEPFAHVDEPLRGELAADLLALLDTFGATVLLVSHDGAHASAICQRIGILDQGRLVQCGSPREVYDSPKTAAAARMTGPAFLVEGEADGGVAETPIGRVPLRGADGAGKGRVCLRPESFLAKREEWASETTPVSMDATVLRSAFITGRWRVHFILADREFWMWSDSPIEPGARVRLAIAPCPWI